MWLVESQSIPKITSNSRRGKQIRFTLYLRPSTFTGHLAHKNDVLTKPDAGVDTTRSHCSSQTDRPKLCAQVLDTKECVAPESYNTHRFTSNHTTTHNEVTWACCLCSSHGVHSARCLRHIASPTLLVLGWGRNWGTCRYPREGGAILAKVAFLATIVAPLKACKLGANIPLVRSPTLVALNLTLLGRRLRRPLRLGMRPSIGFPPLFVPMPGPRWSSHSLLMWVLGFHLHLQLLYDPSLLHQGCKVFDG